MQRLSDESEAAFHSRREPATGNFVGGEIKGVTVMTVLEGSKVAAVNVLTAEDALNLPGFQALSAEFLEQTDKVCTHFPR